MTPIEAFSLGKSASRPCEDGYVVTEHFAAVVDGSTSKSTRQPAGGLTTGRRAMLTVTGAIACLPAGATCGEAVRRLTESLREATPGVDALPAPERPTCSAAIYSRQRREVWLIGDCQCRLAGHTYTNPKTVDTVLTRIRADVTRHLLDRGHTTGELLRDDPGRRFILPALREQTFFQNDADVRNPFRYAVLDGTPVDLRLVPVVEAGGAGEVILATDGYPLVEDTLAATEDTLADLLRRDPLCIGVNAATKCLLAGQRSFDDRTYLRLSLSSPSGK